MTIASFGVGLEDASFGTSQEAAIFGPQGVTLTTTIRAAIIDSVYSNLNNEYPNKVYIGRRLPIDLADFYGISVDWSQDQTDYSAGMMTATPQHELTLVINIAARSINPAQPVTSILDAYSAGVETALYSDQTFGGLATGMEISAYTLELDEDPQSTAGTLRMEFTIFYYAAEGLPKVPIT